MKEEKTTNQPPYDLSFYFPWLSFLPRYIFIIFIARQSLFNLSLVIFRIEAQRSCCNDLLLALRNPCLKAAQFMESDKLVKGENDTSRGHIYVQGPR